MQIQHFLNRAKKLDFSKISNVNLPIINNQKLILRIAELTDLDEIHKLEELVYGKSAWTRGAI